MHIPRTAGTTFGYLLRSAYGDDRVEALRNVFKGSGGVDRETFARRRPPRAASVVLTGHVPLGMLRSWLPADTRYVTFLRDPVQRTLSHYRNVVRARDRHYMVVGQSARELFADGEYLPSDLQTRMLCDDAAPFGEVTPAMVEQAKANLAGLVDFGLTERFDESLALLGRRLGVAFARPRDRRRDAASEPPPLSKTIRAIREHNRHDAELYRWAQERFAQRLAELQDTVAGVA